METVIQFMAIKYQINKWQDGSYLNIPYYFAKIILLPSVSGGNLLFECVSIIQELKR